MNASKPRTMVTVIIFMLTYRENDMGETQWHFVGKELRVTFTQGSEVLPNILR